MRACTCITQYGESFVALYGFVSMEIHHTCVLCLGVIDALSISISVTISVSVTFYMYICERAHESVCVRWR